MTADHQGWVGSLRPLDPTLSYQVGKLRPKEAQVCPVIWWGVWNSVLVISTPGTLPICHATPRISALIKSWSRESSWASHSYPTPSISPAVPAAPPPGPKVQPPLSPEPTPREPAHSDVLDAASSSSSSSCPPCSPEPGREAPGPEPAAAAVESGVSGEGRSEKGRLYCPTCKVTVNSASQLQAHNTGQCAPHQLESRGGDGPQQAWAGESFRALCSRAR